MYEDERFILISRLEALRVPPREADAEWLNRVRETLNDCGDRMKGLLEQIERLTPEPASEGADEPQFSRDSISRIVATAISRLVHDRVDDLSAQLKDRINNHISNFVETNTTVRAIKYLLIVLAIVAAGGSLSVLGATVWQGYDASKGISTAAASALDEMHRQRTVVEGAAHQLNADIQTFDTRVDKRLKEVMDAEVGKIRDEIASLIIGINSDIEGLRSQIDDARSQTNQTLASLKAELDTHGQWAAGQIDAQRESVDQRIGYQNEAIDSHEQAIGQRFIALNRQLEDYEGRLAERLTEHDRATNQRLDEFDRTIQQHEDLAGSLLQTHSKVVAARLITFDTVTTEPSLHEFSQALMSARSLADERLRGLNQELSTTEDMVKASETNLINLSGKLIQRIGDADQQLSDMVDNINNDVTERQRQLREMTADLETSIKDIETQVGGASADALEQARGRFKAATDAALEQHEVGVAAATRRAEDQLNTATEKTLTAFRRDALGQGARLQDVWTQELTTLDRQRGLLKLNWKTLEESVDGHAAQAQANIDKAVKETPALVDTLSGRVADLEATISNLQEGANTAARTAHDASESATAVQRNLEQTREILQDIDDLSQRLSQPPAAWWLKGVLAAIEHPVILGIGVLVVIVVVPILVTFLAHLTLRKRGTLHPAAT